MIFDISLPPEVMPIRVAVAIFPTPIKAILLFIKTSM
jgi:hypothetical protein